jgi:hypothetical protein
VTDFVDDYTDPPETKVDATSVAAGASTAKYVRAADINNLSAAVASLRTALLGNKYDKRFNVTRYGATGNGVSDDLPAFNACYAAARAAGGGLIFLPRPPVCYRLSGQWLLGQRWVDERFVKWVGGSGVTDLTLTAGYDATKRTNVDFEPIVSIEAEEGTDVWGDFAPTNETAIIYYGIGNGEGKGSRPTIKGLQIVGQAGYAGTSPVYPPGNDAVTNNQIGLFLGTATRIVVTHVRGHELGRGIVSTDSYWSRITSCEFFRVNRGLELLSHNAATVQDNIVQYAHEAAYIFTGQGVRTFGNDTEEAVISIWVPGGDQVSIDGGYLESNGALYNGYEILWGDPGLATALQVIWGSVKNVHGYRDHGGHMRLVASQVRAHNVRMYQTSAASLTLLDTTSQLSLSECSLPIDPASTGTYDSTDLVGGIRRNGGLGIAGGRDTSNPTKPGSGLQIGRGGIAVDPSSVVMGFYQDASASSKFRFDLPTGKFANDGGFDYHVDYITTSTTLTAAHHVLHVDCTAGDVTLTLPLISGIGSGRVYRIKRVDASANGVHIASQAANAIEDGATPTNLGLVSGQSVTLVSETNGSTWRIHGTSRWAKLTTFPVAPVTAAAATTTVTVSMTSTTGINIPVGTPVTAQFVDPLSAIGLNSGVIVHARCIVAGQVKVFFTNTSGSSWGDGVTTTCLSISALVTL